MSNAAEVAKYICAHIRVGIGLLLNDGVSGHYPSAVIRKSNGSVADDRELSDQHVSMRPYCDTAVLER